MNAILRFHNVRLALMHAAPLSEMCIWTRVNGHSGDREGSLVAMPKTVLYSGMTSNSRSSFGGLER